MISASIFNSTKPGADIIWASDDFELSFLSLGEETAFLHAGGLRAYGLQRW